jgi:hypothetical protein
VQLTLLLPCCCCCPTLTQPLSCLIRLLQLDLLLRHPHKLLLHGFLQLIQHLCTTRLLASFLQAQL